LTLEALKPILSNPNLYFIDLQYNDTSKERENFYKDNDIKINKIEEIDNFKDIDDITSLIDICDFIITVSNSNAHISGALGKKTFLLLPKGKGRLWYWSSKKNKSIWYPSIKIIEQEEPGSWDGAIKKLNKLIKENNCE
jgi:ADP-heptose:LPS heptosyltransferase